MKIINHLKDLDTQSMFLELAYGTHIVTGDTDKSLDDEGSPKNIYVMQKLGKREWSKVRSLYWRGFPIPEADYFFHPGKLSSGFDDPVQGTDAIFNMDIPHSLQAWLRAKLPPDEIQDFDITKEAPTGLFGVFECLKVNQYNSSGIVTDFAFSDSGADIVADLFLIEGRRSPNRIDWGAHSEWRAAMKEQILCDYRLLPVQGFGLTAKYYNGPAFNTFVQERVDPVVEFFAEIGAPAYGLDPNSYSAKFEGYIKPKYSEDYTFYLTHDDDGFLDLNGSNLIPNGASPGSGTTALTANQFYPVYIEWANSGGGLGEIKLEWESASQVREVVPPEYLYPKEKYVDRWRVNIAFKTNTRLDDAVRAVLAQCNSTFQRVNGKYRFFCREQLTGSSFSFDENNNFYPESVSISYQDPTRVRNVWSGKALDLDHRFLEPFRRPVTLEYQDLIEKANQRIDGEVIDFYNSTRFYVHRLLNLQAERNSRSPESIEFTGNAETYPVLNGDRVMFSNEFNDLVNMDCRVVRANDKSSERTADDRDFTLRRFV